MTRWLSKTWALGLGIGVLVLSLLVTSAIVRNHLDQESGGEVYVPITKEMIFNFTPKHDNVNIIILRLKNVAILNSDAYSMQIMSGSEVLVSQDFSGINVGDPSDLRFQFAPIPNTANKPLTLVVKPKSESSIPLKILVSEQGNVSFQVFYRQRSFPAEWFSKIKDLRFLTLWGVTIAILLLYV